MEIVIVVAIWTVLVKRGVEDIWHTARGGTPPRLAAAKARRTSGAAGRYWSTLWDDTFDDMLAKHTAKRARRQSSPSTPRPRGAATEYFAGLFQDGRRTAQRKWDAAWSRKTVKRHLKRLRDSPGRQTVPGEVVPDSPNLDVEPPVRSWLLRRIGWKCIRCGSTRDIREVSKGGVFLGLRYCPRHLAEEFPDAGGPEDGDGPASPPDPSRPQDESEDRPQDGDGPDPHVVPTEDRTTDQDDPPQRDEQEDGDGYEQYLGQRAPADPNEFIPVADMTEDQFARYLQNHPTQEGPTIMTATAVDGIGLDPQIKFCEESEQQYLANAQSNDNDLATSKQFADAYRQQVVVTDAALGGVPQGVALEAVAAMTQAMDKANAAAADMEQIAALYAQAMDKANSAAADMATAAKEFVKYKSLQEGYNAQPDAPDKQYLMAGQ